MEHKQQCECKDKQHVLKKKGADLQKIQTTGVKRNKTGKNTLKHEGPQAQATDPGIVSSPLNTNMKKNSLQNSFQEKATCEEPNIIIQDIVTCVVPKVTNTLYPAITMYEERLRNNTYPASDNSILSSDSTGFCSTCNEDFTYRTYISSTSETFQAGPCAFPVDLSGKRPTTPIQLSPAPKERTVVGKTCHAKGQSITSTLKYNKTNVLCSYPKLRSCKSDSDLLASFETSTTKCKDATTQTDSLGVSSICDKKAKAIDEMKNLKNVFLNFKCHLKEKTKVNLESSFHKIMSDLTQAIPSLSSVTAEDFVEQCEREKEDLPSNVDVCSVASETVENMLEKLESAVEKKCVEMFSQEDVPVNIKPSLTASDEHLPSSNKKPLTDSMPHALDPMYDIAEDMVHTILEMPMSLTSSKQNEYLHPEDSTKLSCQQHKTDPVCMFLQRAGKNKSSLESGTASLIVNEETQNVLSNIFSQSSLIGYIGEAISAILGYMKSELNNERSIASEETVVLLQLLDDILVQLRQEPAKENFQKSRQPRISSRSDTKEKCRLAGTRLSNSPRSGRPFPPINLPGMVLYSEDEETDNIVKNVPDSAFKDEKVKSQEQIPNDSFTKGNTCFKYQRDIEPPTKPVSRSQVAFPDWELKTEPPSLNHKDTLKKKLCLNKVISTFSQDQKHQIQKASENIVTSVLKEMLKDISFVPPGHLDSKTGDEASVLFSQKPQGLSHQEWIDQLFSVSEINTVAQEIRDSVLNILHKAPNYISNTTNSYISSSVHQTSLDSSDAAHRVKEAPNKCSLKTWLVSEKKMQSLSSFNIDSKKLSWLKSGESELKPVDDINDKIIHIIFKRLKSFICPKLHMGFKSSLQSQLSRYTAKIVNIVLCAIQNEVELHKKNLNLMEIDHTKSLTANTNKKLESLVTSIDDDILASPLLTRIYDTLSSKNADQRNISLSSCMPKSANDSVDEQSVLPNRQDKKSFHKYMATPCALHSGDDEKDIQNNAKLEVLDRIEETLHEMLSKLLGSQETTNKNQKMTAALQSNTQLISKAIFDYILAKLSGVDMDTSFASCGLKAISETLDIDNPSFASILEKMAKSTKIMSSIVSRMVQEGNKEGTQSKAKPVAPVSSKAESTKEMHPNKLRTVASDILNIVFAKLKEFANGYLEILDAINDENKKSNKMGWECESTNISRETHEESFLSALYMPAKKVSSAIMKAIQTELNVTSSDLKTSVKTPPRETQILMDVVKLILDAVSSDMFNQTESEEGGIETYRYRPTYGSLPGGAESDSFLEDDAYTEKKIIDDRSLQKEEMKTHSLKQWALEKTLRKIEAKLKEPNISPIAPIIRNILNEIFQSTLINQLNVLSLSHSHFHGMPHNVDEPIAQTSVQCMHKMIDSLISEADIAIVTENIVNTVFHKLYSAAMTERNVRKNRYETINFSANVSFHEHSYEEKSSVLDKNPCTSQSRFSVPDKEAKVNVVEDIVQAILTNLETFATSKVKSIFCSQVNFTAPMALPIQQDQSTLSKALSAKDPYSDEQFSYCSVDHTKSGETNLCQLCLSKLNTYAQQVARKTLQEIKHELDKEKENHFLTDNIGISKSIAKQECFEGSISQKLFGKASSSTDSQYQPKNKPGIFPAKFLEDIITEIVKKLIFSSIPETQIQDRGQNVHDEKNQAKLYDTAMKLIDLLLKEFSDAQIKVFRPDTENQFFPPVGKEPTTDEAPSSVKIKSADKMPPVDKVTKKPSSVKTPSTDKTLVNKVVHSSVCNILNEYGSQDSICKNINSNGENLARRLTSAVINEIFQHQLNLVFCDKVSVSACFPLESKKLVKKVQKLAQTASKECQTSSPYTIILPHKFLENVISALLSKIFSTISSTETRKLEDNLFTELDFFQMKLVSAVATEISQNKHMIIQYVESLQSDDHEITELVVQSVYNKLLPQFGSQEIIQNCVTSGCKILSETIVDLVLREVAGNQLQSYFCGGLTPHQCVEVENIIENILKDVFQTTDVPLPKPSHAHKLSYNIIEEIAVKFLSKLLSVFPNVHKERTKSLETEMLKITSKVLNSVQEFIFKSTVKLVAPTKESPTVPAADNATIENIVNSVFTSVLKHFGSFTSIFEYLMAKGSVLSDIIGFLLVNAISNSEFQPQVEEEVSNSELVLEAVKIMEKVTKIIDELKSKEKSSSRKGLILDATLLEEVLALFLAKLVRFPSSSSKDEKNLSKPELHKIASQLTKSVTAEISRSSISLIASDPEKHCLNPENIESVYQVVNSVYNNILQQSGTNKEFYYDIEDTNTVFPKVASLIIDGVSSFPLDTIGSTISNADLSGELDINRIVQKAQEHAINVIPELEEEQLDQVSSEEEYPIKIVPYVGKKPVKIDPKIISEHLAVTSTKTQPLKELKQECLKRTGLSIAELRRASISGRNYTSESPNLEKRKRERRASLDKTGRLDAKPLEAVGRRNSFQNTRKPDITRVELLKDVQSKNDLIFRLVAHDIDRVDLKNDINEELNSDEDEVVLRETVAEEDFKVFKDQVKEVKRPEENKVSPKSTRSTSRLKKLLSLFNCCQTTASVNIESTEATSNQVIESKETHVKRPVAELDMAIKKAMPETASSSWEEKPLCKKEEKNLLNEPPHYFIHRIMSSSSYDQEDLISSTSEAEDRYSDPSAEILEESSQEQKPENRSSVEFITIFERSKDVDNANSSNISETPKPNVSKRGCKMLTKMSSALSKVFSRNNTNISRSSSPTHHHED
ncbi:fibrous sheath-interacting protein 2-like isoform X3 [Aotus nancymaae]|uniref:fibrous sheath-interacting protein 2-like isoform X3 n=1 Tax=Aotus nancymaae TaxID=37293 RepID=UPI0030FE2B7D